jgi:uncharacterized protein with HEPN domain
MRREELYLRDIVDASDAIQRFVEEVDEQDFIADEMLQSAVLQKLMIIGEAAARISESIRKQYPEIPWTDIVGFRNIVVHVYFAVDWSIVWTTATKDVPELKQQITSILDSDYGNQE